MHKKLREPFNGLSHLITAVAAVFGLAALLYAGRDDNPRLVSFLIYGLSLVLMFSASAAYHLAPSGKTISTVLRRLDHSAIYLLIAGTYTPITIHFFSGPWRLGILIAVWSIAIIGIGVKIFVITAPRWVTAGIYLLMGWMAVIAVQEILTSMPAGALAWLLAGGLWFTVGAIIYILKKPDLFPGVFGFHEVWHIFVILGCLSHYIAVFCYIGLS